MLVCSKYPPFETGSEGVVLVTLYLLKHRRTQFTLQCRFVLIERLCFPSDNGQRSCSAGHPRQDGIPIQLWRGTVHQHRLWVWCCHGGIHRWGRDRGAHESCRHPGNGSEGEDTVEEGEGVLKQLVHVCVCTVGWEMFCPF